MITPSFYLKDPKAEESSIYMGIRLHDKKLFKHYLPFKVKTSTFNKKTQRPADITLTNYIDDLELKTKQAIDDIIKISGKVYKEDLKHKLSSTNLNSYIETFVKKSNYKKSTIKSYKTFKNVFDNFREEVPFDKVNNTLFNDFLSYMEGLNYSNNSIIKNVKMLKVVMGKSLDDGLHNNTSFKNFKISNKNKDLVYLTEKDVKSINDLELDDYLTEVRKAFFTKKYTKISKHEVNYFIKNICKKAGINELITLPMIKNYKKVTIQKQKFELVTILTPFCYLFGN